MYEVAIQDLPARRLAALTHLGAYHAIGRTMGDLDRRIAQSPLAGHTGEAVAIYYDAPGSVPDDQLCAHAGLVIGADQAVPDGFDTVDLPGGSHAVLTLRGPYSGIPDAWTHLYSAWLPGSGRHPAARAPFEVYVSDMATTPAAELVTLICMPLG